MALNFIQVLSSRNSYYFAGGFQLKVLRTRKEQCHNLIDLYIYRLKSRLRIICPEEIMEVLENTRRA